MTRRKWIDTQKLFHKKRVVEQRCRVRNTVGTGVQGLNLGVTTEGIRSKQVQEASIQIRIGSQGSGTSGSGD